MAAEQVSDRINTRAHSVFYVKHLSCVRGLSMQVDDGDIWGYYMTYRSHKFTY